MENIVEALQKLGTELSSRDRALRLAREWDANVNFSGLGAAVLAEMETRKPDVIRGLCEASWKGVSYYREMNDPALQAQTVDHVRQHVEAIISIASGSFEQSREDPVDFIRNHAVMRARQGFPLMALLHAYRYGHRGTLAVLQQLVNKHAPTEADRLRALAAVSEFTIEYTDLISVVLTEAYTNEERYLIEQRTRARFTLLDDLLNGRNHQNAEARAALKSFMIADTATMYVLVGMPDESAGHEALRAVAEQIEQTVRHYSLSSFVEVYQGKVVAILVIWRWSQKELIDGLRQDLQAPRNGNRPVPLRAGLSYFTARIAEIPTAYEQAQQAIAFASVDRVIVGLFEISLLDYMIRNADRTARQMRPVWLDEFAALGDGTRDSLYQTLQAYADANMNLSQTAAALGVHVNTVYFRLNKVTELIGRDVREFRHLSDALLSLEFDRLNPRGGGAAF